MPISDLSSEQAVSNRKGNPFGVWGERSGVNRIEPIAKPAFDVPFVLAEDDKIFTVGSCFARNVEAALQQRGFVLPMREVFTRPEFDGADLGIINNYGTPSIYNEIAWAFDEEEYDADNLIGEVLPGKFADLNLSGSMRPEVRPLVDRRREAIKAAYRTSADCRLIVMTLGLSEVWFDTKTGTYLNVSPRPSMMRSEPERFRLHTLSFEETFSFLDRAIGLLQKHGRSDQRVVLTVSPVPLMSTHRAQDVILANTYSKAVLRVAAETIIAKYDHVTYFPSFESFTLSDRRQAFVDDMVHTNMDIVAFNVGRMVDAYTASGEDLESIRSAIAVGGDAVALAKAEQIAPGLAEDFFAEHSAIADRSRPFAKIYARYLSSENRHAEADVALSAHDADDDLELLTLKIAAATKMGDAERAIAMIEQVPTGSVKAPQLWMSLLEAAVTIGNPDLVVAMVARISSNLPRHSGNAYFEAGRFFRSIKDEDRALHFLKSAWEFRSKLGPGVEYADLLLSVGRQAEAREVIDVLKRESPDGEDKRLKRLLVLV